jgi:hypothetical protein
MRTGGSAGHSSAWSIDIQEGTLSNDMLGQKWEVKVRSCKSFIQEKEKQKEEETQDKLNRRILKIVDYLSQQPTGDTQSGIKDSLGMSGKVALEAINVAIARDLIKPQLMKKGNRDYKAYVLKNAHPDNPDKPDGQDSPS